MYMVLNNVQECIDRSIASRHEVILCSAQCWKMSAVVLFLAFDILLPEGHGPAGEDWGKDRNSWSAANLTYKERLKKLQFLGPKRTQGLYSNLCMGQKLQQRRNK